jgi:excisionase family DNA binding protein
MAGQSPEAMLTRTEVAALLKVSVPTLERWAAQGKGPPYAVLGRNVRYPAKWLSQWVVDCAKAA